MGGEWTKRLHSGRKSCSGRQGFRGRQSLRTFDLGPTNRYNRGTELCVRGKDAMVAMSVHARRRDEGRETLEQFERRESQLGPSVRCGLGKPVDEPGLIRGK